MDRQIKALRNFKKYEDIFYSYLNKNSPHTENLDFFLVPKDYINHFCEEFNYRKNINELNNLNIYHDSEKETEENKIIEETIINCLRESNKSIIDNNLKLNKINNDKMISNYSFKLNKEGLFIPLAYNIWDKLSRYYGYDTILKRKGFINKGEVFIETEEKRIDCFFKNVKTGEKIYHFCFIMENDNNFKKLKKYFKNYSAKELIEKMQIKYVGNKYLDERFKKIDKKIPSYVNDIGGFPVILYYLDSYIFKENKTFESITFQVEKNLAKPKVLYATSNIDDILKNIFKIGKGNNSFEILMHNFDTEEKKFFNNEKKSLLRGLILAYKNHYPIVITPDMIWILILQGYSRFMEKYHELFREKYVNFQGKKVLEVKKIGIFPEDASPETWQEIIDDFTEGIKYYIGGDIMSNLQSDFTTTDSVTLATSQAAIMSSMKNYFTFNLGMGGCGISSITLEGTIEDWEKIKSKLKFFSKKEFGLNWWFKHLIPIIDKIIMTKSYYTKEKKINHEIKNFWKDMIRVKDSEDSYNPFILNGWIIKFVPNLSEEAPKLYENELHEEDIPDQIISCPLKLTVFNLDFTKTIYNCSLASGFYGMIQDKKDFSVRPVIGYALISEDKSNCRMTEKEVKEVFI